MNISTDNTPASPHQRNRPSGKLLATLTLIGIFAAVAGIWFLFFKNPQKPTTSTSPQSSTQSSPTKSATNTTPGSAASSKNTTTADNKVELVKYTHPASQYSVSYPKDWKITETSLTHGINIAGPNGENISIYKHSTDDNFGLKKGLQVKAAKEAGYYRIDQVEKQTLAGTKYGFKIEAQNDTGRYLSRTVTDQHKATRIITVTYPTNCGDVCNSTDHQLLMEDILNSFTVE